MSEDPPTYEIEEERDALKAELELVKQEKVYAELNNGDMAQTIGDQVAKIDELNKLLELNERQIEGWKELEDETEIQEKVYNEDIRVLLRVLASVVNELESMKQWDKEQELRRKRKERESKED
jgi:hypothetical protein